jgi:uncharacterized membrane protein YphA (DoxX/SURF4 family)
MEKSNKTWLIILVARTVVGITLFVAAFLKALSPDSLMTYLNNIGLTSSDIQIVSTKAIIMVEAVTGLMLVSGLWQRSVATFSAILFFAFVLLTAYELRMDWDSTCGCFGGMAWIEGSPITRIVQNTLLLFLCILVVRYGKSNPQRRLQVNWAMTTIGMVTVGVVALTQTKLGEHVHTRADERRVILSRNSLDDFQRELQQDSLLVITKYGGSQTTIKQVLREYPATLLAFFTPEDCLACLEILHGLPEIPRDIQAAESTQILGIGMFMNWNELDNFRNAYKFELATVMLKQEVINRLPRIPTPFVIVTTSEGEVEFGSRVVAGESAREKLFADLRAQLKLIFTHVENPN